MKHKILMTLPLAAAMAVSGLAQQAPSSTPSENPQAQSTADQNPPAPTSSQDQAASTRQPLTYEQHEGFWGKLNPFARKKYVQRQLDPIRGRVNELDELTAQNAKMIKDVDTRAQEGIRVAMTKANEADSHAVDAGNRAQLANQTAQQATTRLATVEQTVGKIDQYQPITQAEIRFRPGQMMLSKKAKEALDEMATPLKDQKGYIVEVQGFSSGRGQQAIQNSQQMAQSVVRYLVLNHEIPVYRIYVLGMGNAPVPATTEGGKAQRTRGGRVEISLLKNSIGDLDNMTQPAAAPAATPSGQPNSSQSMTTEPDAGQSAQQQNPK